MTVDGPKLVLSVSQTFIKLKDLIVEKKHLQREIESLKNLNSKLESKVHVNFQKFSDFLKSTLQPIMTMTLNL